MRTLRGHAFPLALLLVGCGGMAGDNTTASGSPTPEVGSVLQAMLDTERDGYSAPGALAVIRVGDGRWAATTGTSTTSGPPSTRSTKVTPRPADADADAAKLTDPALAKEAKGLEKVTGQALSDLLRTGFVEPLGLDAFATGCGVFHGHGVAVNGTGSIAMVSADARDGVVIAENLLSDADADLPALAEQMICTAKG